MNKRALGVTIEILDGISNPPFVVTTLLRRCLIVSQLLNLEGKWLTKELEGYNSTDELPDYRNITLRCRYSWRGSHPRVVPRIKESLFSDWFKAYKEYKSIPELEHTIGGYQFDIEKKKMQTGYFGGYNSIESFYVTVIGQITNPQVQKILDSVTYRVLNFANKMYIKLTEQTGTLKETKKEPSVKEIDKLKALIQTQLRRNVHEEPKKEAQIQDILETIFNVKGYEFLREKEHIDYSSKTYVPDFTFKKMSTVVEVKLCKTNEKEKRIISEINDDILAYKTRYKNIVFVVYDLGIIRDDILFKKDISNYPDVYVIIVKH